jgi:hypothetical protein
MHPNMHPILVRSDNGFVRYRTALNQSHEGLTAGALPMENECQFSKKTTACAAQ